MFFVDLKSYNVNMSQVSNMMHIFIFATKTNNKWVYPIEADAFSKCLPKNNKHRTSNSKNAQTNVHLQQNKKKNEKYTWSETQK